MKRFIASFSVFALLAAAAAADDDEEIFSIGNHCVAYRTVKDVLFTIDSEIIGRNCDVTAWLIASQGAAGPRIVVEVPIERFKSGNRLRDRSVRDLLGAKTQPDLRFSSAPIDVEALRTDLASRGLRVPGVLTIGGRDFPVEFPLEVVEHEGRFAVKGRLSTTFAAFEVEVPTVAGGLIARPHEDLELVVRLELGRVEGLEEWAREQGLR